MKMLNEEQRILFGEQGLMTYPKPVLLIMKLIASVREDTMTVLRFLFWLGNNSEAVMRMNAKGKTYRYIIWCNYQKSR